MRRERRVQLAYLAHDDAVFVVGLRPKVKAVLDRLGAMRVLPAGHAAMSRLDALREAAALTEARE